MSSTGSVSPTKSRTSSPPVSTSWSSGPGTATAGLRSPGYTLSSPGQVGPGSRQGQYCKMELEGAEMEMNFSPPYGPDHPHCISEAARSSLSASGALTVVPVISVIVIVVHVLILPAALK